MWSHGEEGPGRCSISQTLLIVFAIFTRTKFLVSLRYIVSYLRTWICEYEASKGRHKLGRKVCFKKAHFKRRDLSQFFCALQCFCSYTCPLLFSEKMKGKRRKHTSKYRNILSKQKCPPNPHASDALPAKLQLHIKLTARPR